MQPLPQDEGRATTLAQLRLRRVSPRIATTMTSSRLRSSPTRPMRPTRPISPGVGGAQHARPDVPRAEGRRAGRALARRAVAWRERLHAGERRVAAGRRERAQGRSGRFVRDADAKRRRSQGCDRQSFPGDERSRSPDRRSRDARARCARGATAVSPDASAQPVKTISVTLEPESLGTVTLRMRLSGNQLSVRVDVAEPATLELIQRDRDRLQKTMTSDNVSIDRLEIRGAKEAAPVQGGDNANAPKQDMNAPGQQSRQNNASPGGEQRSAAQPFATTAATAADPHQWTGQ